MAVLALETLRNTIRTQIYGRRLGLDQTKDEITTFGGTQMRGGFLVGHMGQRLPIQYVGTTAASTLYFSGFIELATAASTQTFNAPIPGVEVIITQTATSTAGIQLRLTNGNFNTTTGSSPNQITFSGQGAAVRLLGLSTALAAVTGVWPSGTSGVTTGYVSFSTY